jgi:hypothetical protein
MRREAETMNAGDGVSAPAGRPGVVDHTALRVNQAAIVALLTIAYLTDQVWLVAAVGLVMAAGTIHASLALFQRLYRDVLRPAGLLRPDPRPDDPAPHRFAQGMGAAVLMAAVAALVIGAPAIGWALTLLVAALAGVNLVFGFCAGCFIFFHLQRLRQARRHA